MVAPKVLVVDDSWTDLALIATSLRESGFDVITAVDGEEAIEKVLSEQPRCVLLDIVLPKLDGWRVCRRLKSMEQSRHIPIIMISQKNTPLDQRHGLQQGAEIYLTKPFSRDELLTSVRSLTGFGS
jgi:twitching motility two-component system response regulator PilH